MGGFWVRSGGPVWGDPPGDTTEDTPRGSPLGSPRGAPGNPNDNPYHTKPYQAQGALPFPGPQQGRHDSQWRSLPMAKPSKSGGRLSDGEARVSYEPLAEARNLTASENRHPARDTKIRNRCFKAKLKPTITKEKPKSRNTQIKRILHLMVVKVVQCSR
jgi:hypothetical protein